MQNNFLISGGHVICPAQGIDGDFDVLVENGQIAKIGKSLPLPENFQQFPANGKLVCPGLFDMHVHLREPGREDKETIESGMRSALAGGVTSLLAMPNTNPEICNQAVVEFCLRRAEKLQLARLFVAGKITENGGLTQMKEMKNSGAVAFTNDGSDVESPDLLAKALEWAKTFRVPILTHAEIADLSQDGQVNEGEVSLQLGLAPISASAEILAVEKSLTLAAEHNAQIHITHVSTAGAVERIRTGKKGFSKISCEATPHHFALNENECLGFNTNAKMFPPLRSESDRLAILQGLQDGTIDAIASDHAPHLPSEKMLPFAHAPRGTVGLETTFAAANTFLVREKVLTLAQAVEKMTLAPARLLGLESAIGSLKIGQPADIAIFNLEREWQVNPEQFASKGRNCAFAGKKLHGKCEATFVDGILKFTLAKK